MNIKVDDVTKTAVETTYVVDAKIDGQLVRGMMWEVSFTVVKMYDVNTDHATYQVTAVDPDYFDLSQKDAEYLIQEVIKWQKQQ